MGQQNTSVLEYRFKFTVPIALILVRALQRNRTNRSNTHIDTHKHTRTHAHAHALVIIVQLLSCIRLFVTPWTAARQAPLSFTISWNLLRLMSTESVMPSIQPSHPLLSPSPLALSLSQYEGLFQSVSSSGGQSIEASVSVLPMNIQGWFPSGLIWSSFSPRALKSLL